MQRRGGSSTVYSDKIDIINICLAKNKLCPRKIGMNGKFDLCQPGNILSPAVAKHFTNEEELNVALMV